MDEIIDDSVEIVELQIPDKDLVQIQADEDETEVMESDGAAFDESPVQFPAGTQPEAKSPHRNKLILFFFALGHWLFFLRKVFLALPVIYAAVRLAVMNSEKLPDFVGLMLQADGSFLVNLPRTMAVLGPLALTLGCLLMMFLSRKSLYAWAISIFTLTLPILLLVSNIFPA